MKKIILSALLLLGLTTVFTACEDDRDSNPTLTQPENFVLNTPAYASEVIDLSASESLRFTWSQPDYGFPVVAQYFLQFSVDGNFTVSVEEAEADETHAKVADFVSADDAYTTCAHDYSAESVSRMLQKLCKWTEDGVPAVQEVYVRMYAEVPVSGGAVEPVAPIASNVVKIRVAPHYVELKDALPEMWYLIGASIGDGKWNNNPDAIGTSVIPMNVISNYAYDKKNGEGVITFTGYFDSTKGFKIIHTPGSWAEQWGQDGQFGKYRQKDGDAEGQDIMVPTTGFYTVKLDTKNDELTIEAADVTPQVFSAMYITGDFAGWAESANAMTPVNTAVAENHVWSYVLDATAGPTGCKFLQPGWNPNWGASSFPYGVGTNGGDNIPVEAGKYVVVFNDVDGSYNFIAK